VEDTVGGAYDAIMLIDTVETDDRVLNIEVEASRNAKQIRSVANITEFSSPDFEETLSGETLVLTASWNYCEKSETNRFERYILRSVQPGQRVIQHPITSFLW
jgi:hypothetical protein